MTCLAVVGLADLVEIGTVAGEPSADAGEHSRPAAAAVRFGRADGWTRRVELFAQLGISPRKAERRDGLVCELMTDMRRPSLA